MSFFALTTLAQQTAAGIFGGTPDGKRLFAWFPPVLEGENAPESNPDEPEGFTVPLGAVSVGAARARSRDPLEMVERAEQLEGVSLSRAAWYAAYGDHLPVKSMTCFIIGPALDAAGTEPDPARAVRYTVESEVRLSAGVMEIDALRHPDYFLNT